MWHLSEFFTHVALNVPRLLSQISTLNLSPLKRGTHFPHMSLFLVRIMKSLICWARQLIASFTKYFKGKFDNKWVALKNLIDTEPDLKALDFCKQSQKGRDAFLGFYQEHSTLTSAGSQCQYLLLSGDNQHILTKAIPYDICKFKCDCSAPIEAFVPKRTNNSAMTCDVSGDLADGYFNHLFASLYSVLLID